MKTYTEHNDRANLEQRLRVLTNKDERARLAALAEERDFGAITLFMSAHELKARRAEGYWLGWGRIEETAPRREREFHRSTELAWRAQHASR